MSCHSLRLGIKPALFLVLLLLQLHTVTAEVPDLQVAVFSTEITPPLNEPVGMGFVPVPRTVEHPLLAKGVVFKQNNRHYVLCALDWMEVHNESYDALRKTLAEAAHTTSACVALHCLHQHTAPAIDSTSQKLYLKPEDPRRIASLKYEQHVTKLLHTAVRKSLKSMQPVTGLGISQCIVERVASNRRLKQADGSIRARLSSTKVLELQNAPQGLIDPWMRTLSLFNQNQCLLQIHYYATHPQSFYGDARISYDTVGIARERLQKKNKVFQLYFTACGGNIAMGKYNNGTREARQELSERLFQAMECSLTQIERLPAASLQWQTTKIQFTPRRAAEFQTAPHQAILQNQQSLLSQKIKSAMIVAWNERLKQGDQIELSCLTLGKVSLLHLPGEPFVEFQLAAQKTHPELFLLTAGYGDCAMGYIGTEISYSDRGGYEQTWSFIEPGEALLQAAIEQLLAGNGCPH